MILLPVDEAYAFDYLAILQIKNNDNLLDDKIYYYIIKKIKKQIGIVKYEAIIKSKEYKELLASNKVVFKNVDLARQNKISAFKLDKSNFKRYLAKKKIQQKFFKSNLFEVKKYKK